MGDDAPFMTFARAIAQGDQARVLGLLAGAPELALARVAVGATRHGADGYYLDDIGHYVYGGHTALHIAAAAYEAGIARELANAGAIIAAVESSRCPAASLRGRRDARVREMEPGRATGDGRMPRRARRGPKRRRPERDGTIASCRAQSMRRGRQGATRRRREPSSHERERIHLHAACALDDWPRRKRVG